MDFYLLVILSCLLVAGTAQEKRSSAGPPNNFLDAFYAQWTCNEKDELLNEYEMTSLILKETLKIVIKMTEGNKLSDCYTNDVTNSTSNGPQVMYLYTSRNNMCNNTQHILTTFTTFNNRSSSNSVSCLLHHPTRITSTAFVATAVCANIYDKIDLSPAIASVTCLGDDGWEVHEGIGLDCWEDHKYKYEKLQPYPVDNQPHTLANCKDKCAQHSQCQAIIMPRAEIENGESTTCYMIKKINNIFSECTWGHTDTYNVYEKKVDCQYGNGANYTGSVSVTKSGLQCQKWSSQSPHEHSWGDLGDHNYCRNPNPIAENGVWCYTTDSNVRFERCGVPVCAGQSEPWCPFRYTPKSGDVPGWGSLEGKIQVKSRLECARLCNQKQNCASFEHSDTSKICNLNKERNPTSGNYKDQQFCSTKLGCPTGWTEHVSTGCYKLTNVGTHQQAIDDCKKDGGYLAEIDSREENFALMSYKNENAWLGATDIEKEGEWVWSHSGRKVSFVDWQKGEPNGRTRENCLRFTKKYKNGNWNAADCGEKHKGVCELDTEI